MTRREVVAVRLVAGLVLALVTAVLVARGVAAHERAGWDPHYGDPDGEAIAQVFGFLAGAVAFVTIVAACGLLELTLWLRRRRATRLPTKSDAEGQHEH